VAEPSTRRSGELPWGVSQAGRETLVYRRVCRRRRRRDSHRRRHQRASVRR